MILRRISIGVIFLLTVIITRTDSETANDNEVCNATDEADCAKPKQKSSLEIHQELQETLKGIKESCGELCNTNIKGVKGKYYNFIKKEVNCDALFENQDIDRPSQFYSPPARIPKSLQPYFTYDGRVQIK